MSSICIDINQIVKCVVNKLADKYDFDEKEGLSFLMKVNSMNPKEKSHKIIKENTVYKVRPNNADVTNSSFKHLHNTLEEDLKKNENANQIVEDLETSLGRKVNAKSCVYCKKQCKSNTEEMVPITKRGRMCKMNVFSCCGICNSSKGDLNVEEWLTSNRPRAKVVSEKDKIILIDYHRRNYDVMIIPMSISKDYDTLTSNTKKANDLYLSIIKNTLTRKECGQNMFTELQSYIDDITKTLHRIKV